MGPVARVERKPTMRAAKLEHAVCHKGNRVARLAVYAALAAASLLAVRAWAGPDGVLTGTKAESGSADAAARVTPNYALEERFLPDAVNKLVFDLAVTPHWFRESDRFWYSYQT